MRLSRQKNQEFIARIHQQYSTFTETELVYLVASYFARAIIGKTDLGPQNTAKLICYNTDTAGIHNWLITIIERFV